MCLHQHPVGYNDHTHTPECPDFCIVKWNEDPPCKVVGVSNFKNDDKHLKTSIKERFGYSTKVIEKSGSCEEYAVRLSFPFTQSRILLQLYVAFKKWLMRLDIMEAYLHSKEDLKWFFYVSYVAVHYMLGHHVYVYGVIPVMSPKNDLEFNIDDCLTQKNFKYPARVFKKDRYVYKLFDTTNKGRVNFDLVQLSLCEYSIHKHSHIIFRWRHVHRLAKKFVVEDGFGFVQVIQCQGKANESTMHQQHSLFPLCHYSDQTWMVTCQVTAFHLSW